MAASNTSVDSSGDNASRVTKPFFKRLVQQWLFSSDRPILIRWSFGFFSFATLLLLFVALRYLSSYRFTCKPLALLYVAAAFTGHFASIMLIVWTGAVLPLIALFPSKKVIVPFCILIVSLLVTIVLLDSQVYTVHRFHFTLLTVRILGWRTWGFGMLYAAILLAFNSFLARIVWQRHIVLGKRVRPVVTIPVVVIMLLFTHGVHIWADAAGYSPVTGFTTTLPMFYPSTGKKQMVKLGIVDMANRRGMQIHSENRAGFHYPRAPLSFTPLNVFNILIIAVDAMRSDALADATAPCCMKFAREKAAMYTNHWSGGNSTKMGCFSLFYGIPPTYQQYIETNKVPPVLIDRLLEQRYQMGIFTSHPLYRPAGLDVTAFAKIPDLRLETAIPGPKLPWRNDSAITVQWMEWLDRRDPGRPFFGFLFFDALCSRTFPPSFERRMLASGIPDRLTDSDRYKISMMYVDSLVCEVLADLADRQLMDSTIVIFTADHGNEFDDNGLGIKGHGSAFSDYQLRVPLAVHWPGRQAGVFAKRTSHNDIVPTLMCHALGCNNKISDYSCGFDLHSCKEWEWLIVGSYYNFAIVEPHQITVQFPGGYFEVRDRRYRLVEKPSLSPNIAAALAEMGKYFKQ